MDMDLKVGHIDICGREKLLRFSKATTRSLPPGLIFGQDVSVKIFRSGSDFEINSVKLADRGVLLGELMSYDRVEIRSPAGFYERLWQQWQHKPGLVVWMDADLRTALENKFRASTPIKVRRERTSTA